MAALRGALSPEQWLAEREGLPSGRHHDYPGLTRVTVVHRTGRFPVTGHRHVMIEWLMDENRPGNFDILSSTVGVAGPGIRYELWFTDPNVAFEFKLRWA